MLVVVSEEAADLVRERTKSIEVRLIDRLAGTLPATLAREVPSVTDKLPNLALSTIGGGEIVMDPRKPEEGKALSRMLQLELRFASQVYVTTLGGRTFVRFYHGVEPVAWRLYRSLRQLFLRHLNV